MKCWRKRGCPFNSNNSLNYMKCWHKDYSVEQCEKDHQEEWNKIDDRRKGNGSMEL